MSKASLAADERWMAATLRFARRGLVATGGGPVNAGLLVRDGIVLARAASPLDAARSPGALGASLYVVLAPDAVELAEIAVAGISRVIASQPNADNPTSATQPVPVTPNVGAEEGRRLNAGFFARTRLGRPYVTLKLAVSADGMIGRQAGERLLVSGAEAFNRLQQMRIEADATLIGIQTALFDDPSLSVSVPGLKGHSPIRIVLDSQARLPVESRLLKGAGETPLVIVTVNDAPTDRTLALSAAGADILPVAAASGGVDLEAALAALAGRGIGRLLVEGGARVAGNWVGQGLVDEVVLFHAPVVIGSDGVRALAGRALSAIERSPRFRLIEEAWLGADRMVRYERAG